MKRIMARLGIACFSCATVCLLERLSAQGWLIAERIMLSASSLIQGSGDDLEIAPMSS